MFISTVKFRVVLPVRRSLHIISRNLEQRQQDILTNVCITDFPVSKQGLPVFGDFCREHRLVLMSVCVDVCDCNTGVGEGAV